MAKKKKAVVRVGSKEIYKFIARHPGCSVPDIAAGFPGSNERSLWSMVSALKKKGMVNNKWKGQWTVVKDTTERLRKVTLAKDIKVAKLVIEIDISLKT